jgi:site-specific DNA recombinase
LLNYDILQGRTFLEVAEMITLVEKPIIIGKARNGKGGKEVAIPVTGKALIYLRVSDSKQERGASFQVQEEACVRYCEAQGLEVIGTLKESISGLIVDRPEYQEALRLARAKAFNKLVVWRYDRSGRDDAEYAGMLKDFAKQGIELVSASGESPDPLYQKLAGVLAWDESRRISIRVTGSKMKRHEEGKWGTKAPFGYTTHQLGCKQRDCLVCQDHTGYGSILVPKQGEAELVTEMFARYASGKYSLMNLRDFLNGAGASKSRYSIWYILTNRAYLGEVPHGRGVNSQFHPAPEKITWSKGQHRALIDQDTFDQVQARLTANKSRQRGGPAAKFLFSGLVFCARCGSRYAARAATVKRGKKWNVYRCNRKNQFGDCESHSISETRIKEAVIPPIEKLLAKLSREDIRSAVRAELVRQEEVTKAADRVTKMGAAETLERLESRLSSLEDAYLDGDIPRDRYRARRDELTSQIKDLQRQLTERPHLALPDLDQLFTLADALGDEPLDDGEWRHVLEGVVEKVVINDRNIEVIWKKTFVTLLAAVSKG